MLAVHNHNLRISQPKTEDRRHHCTHCRYLVLANKGSGAHPEPFTSVFHQLRCKDASFILSKQKMCTNVYFDPWKQLKIDFPYLKVVNTAFSSLFVLNSTPSQNRIKIFISPQERSHLTSYAPVVLPELCLWPAGISLPVIMAGLIIGL